MSGNTKFDIGTMKVHGCPVAVSDSLHTTPHSLGIATAEVAPKQLVEVLADLQ